MPASLSFVKTEAGFTYKKQRPEFAFGKHQGLSPANLAIYFKLEKYFCNFYH